MSSKLDQLLHEFRRDALYYRAQKDIRIEDFSQVIIFVKKSSAIGFLHNAEFRETLFSCRNTSFSG